MVVTRSGSISKAPSQPASTRISKRPPAPISRGRGRGRGIRGSRGRGRGNRPVPSHIQHLAQAFDHAATPNASEPKVTRIFSNPNWASSHPSIAFVHQNHLPTSPDTETIALNLIDYFLIPENWDPRLSGNVLATSCFAFASVLTGVGKKPGVGEGYEVLWERRGEFGGLVGSYARALERMPAPGSVVEEEEEEDDKGTQELDEKREDKDEQDKPKLLDTDDEALLPVMPEEKASEVDLEFDDLEFDVDAGEW